MIGLEVKLKQAQKVKKYLLENNLYNRKFKPIKTKQFIYFPLLKKSKYQGTKLVDKKFIEIKLNDYKDLLKIPKNLINKLPHSYDIIGKIIIVDTKDDLIKYEKQIAEALLKTHKNIKTILKKSGIHSGEFRTQKLKFLAGIKTKETIYKENNVRIKLNVEQVYFSSRLSTERKRIYKQIKPNEKILVMFSGSGPYPLVISKNTQAKKIIGIEKNPVAHKYAFENIKLNKLTNIELINDDVRKTIPKQKQKFDRILMPLPKDADTFLELAFKVSKKGTIIHLYDFEQESEIDLGEEKIKKEAIKAKIKYEIINTVKCGQYSPGKFRICFDFRIK